MTQKHITHWIGGKPWDGEAERHGDVYDPATGQVSGQVDFATPAEVDLAVEAAKDAFQTWRRVSLAKRASVLFAFRELVRSHASQIAQLITEEHGKVASDAAGEVARGLEVVEFACGIPHLLKGGFSENVSTGVDSYSIRQPVGVVAGITPFNFPAMVPMWMFPLAIACGNAFVLKPSEKDPSASLLLASLWAEAGLPDGVFNVVQGDKVAVDAILGHPDIKAVSFVGSTPIARYVYENGTAKQASACRPSAVPRTTWWCCPTPTSTWPRTPRYRPGSVRRGSAAWRSPRWSPSTRSAMSWSAGSRTGWPTSGSGRGSDERSEMGPLVTGPHRDKVASYLDSGVRQGATLAVDGRVHPVIGGADSRASGSGRASWTTSPRR